MPLKTQPANERTIFTIISYSHFNKYCGNPVAANTDIAIAHFEIKLAFIAAFLLLLSKSLSYSSFSILSNSSLHSARYASTCPTNKMETQPSRLCGSIFEPLDRFPAHLSLILSFISSQYIPVSSIPFWSYNIL